jgi:hypothetical protein
LAEICKDFVIKITVAFDGIQFYVLSLLPTLDTWPNQEPIRNSYPNDSKHWELVKGAKV